MKLHTCYSKTALRVALSAVVHLTLCLWDQPCCVSVWMTGVLVWVLGAQVSLPSHLLMSPWVDARYCIIYICVDTCFTDPGWIHKGYMTGSHCFMVRNPPDPSGWALSVSEADPGITDSQHCCFCLSFKCHARHFVAVAPYSLSASVSCYGFGPSYWVLL